MLNNTNVPAIQRAVVVIRDMSADERIREAAMQRETMLHDKATALRFARDTGYTEGMEKGIEKGIEQGEMKAKAALADRMRAKGYSEDMIRELMDA